MHCIQPQCVSERSRTTAVNAPGADVRSGLQIGAEAAHDVVSRGKSAIGRITITRELNLAGILVVETSSERLECSMLPERHPYE